jgi:predicted DNA-binding WGR domain protein
MGYFTIYCILTGAPGIVRIFDVDKRKYKWNNSVRAILKNGNVSDIGTYDYYGNVVIKGKKKSTFDLFPKEEKYSVSDEVINFSETDGYLINALVYKMLMKNKCFKECIKGKNLYNLLYKFIKNNKLRTNFAGVQEIIIKDEYYEFDDILKKNLWLLTNPESKTKNGIRNKTRIDKIISNFTKFVCKSKENGIKEYTFLKLIFKDTKSNKFWNIQYSNKGEYKIHYGRIGSKGKILSKKGNIDEIYKIIHNKIKKGYKKISEKNIKKFTLST